MEDWEHTEAFLDALDGIEHDEDDDDYDVDDELEEAMADCGLDPETGWCGHAGTEYCSFRCIFNPERG